MMVPAALPKRLEDLQNWNIEAREWSSWQCHTSHVPPPNNGMQWTRFAPRSARHSRSLGPPGGPRCH